MVAASEPRKLLNQPGKSTRPTFLSLTKLSVKKIDLISILIIFFIILLEQRLKCH